MRGHGFDIRAMWETTTEARTEFVYILAWPDEATMRARWAGFMADPEWNRDQRQTGADGPLAGATEDRVLRLVASPPVPGQRITVVRGKGGAARFESGSHP